MYTEVLYARINDRHKVLILVHYCRTYSDQVIGLEQLPVLVTKFSEIKMDISLSKT